ncbi:Vacuolar ATPase assembly integral membrane protein [Orbilia oligospora]|uniref:Vacuolar ATPase assembly integral membrane protein n=1 Tax=Orbilia oligospora TaxID=2813651 RepID=A0A6G1LX46_ORBOL|nr:Vacuolar ATPase assembly integral membrane protein [Orbilia oligospora]KAF3199242.1 Vacuolar ATPase assembly integral membrane protein [Orbilia oligospora]KAF3203560.1 Vacuolar ATPase assembly integral membrane protein [Orbilia oligospora]KAF3206168.1 Vacuolar ATPase assembly integral membrane protein [Orbilia oligospora]KAF3236451.1 Vacuolar ATPase assembly integral membrane protein [Orbilia oligospora]
MVQLSHTAASRRAVRAYAAITEDDPNSASIDHARLARIARHYRSCEPHYALDVLLRGTEICFPEKPSKPDPSAAYLTLMEKLRHEQAEKLYASMLNIPEKDDSPHSIAKEISDQISVILNVLFSSIFTGLAIWYATANLSMYKRREPLRVGASITVAVIVAVAEVALFNSYLRKMDDAKNKARLQREIKSITPLKNEPDT